MGKIHTGITQGGIGKTAELERYTDLNQAADAATQHSIGGYLFTIGENPVT